MTAADFHCPTLVIGFLENFEISEKINGMKRYA